MGNSKKLLNVVARVIVTVALADCVYAQGLEPDLLLHPTPDSWPLYHGDYSGRRHSALTQINMQNVRDLGIAWVFQTGRTDALKSSPLLVNGVLYFTVPDN